jgi:type VI protein secretion system component VasF
MVFFEKLERFRTQQDSARLADILEVYLLCLLLGFEGRYSGPLRAELDSITEVIGRRIDDIRGRGLQISPTGNLPPAPLVHPGHAESAPRLSHRLRTVTFASLIFTFLFFLVLYWNLWAASGDLRSRLLAQIGGAQ